MPPKRIIDAVASTCDVIGSSIATVSAGPMPGSTPTAVPSVEPSSAQNRLIGVSAVAKPEASELRISIDDRSQPSRAQQRRQVQSEDLVEHQEHGIRHEEADDEVANDVAAAAREGDAGGE